MAIGDTFTTGPNNLHRINGSGVYFETVQSVDMGNAAHALVVGAAGAAQTQLTGNICLVDPAGGAQNLTLPAEADFIGQLVICNTADAAEAITVKTDGGGTVITLDQNQSGLCVCDGTAWFGFMGGVT